ncbi:LemA family protein [Propionivibrio limicola]|uniref:LemA family protein n=1 Tax=Propionivibrio limicola TaxID=167645 RepID=UPI001B867809|nr:LemA family protein [Propionivibrio limicola]
MGTVGLILSFVVALFVAGGLVCILIYNGFVRSRLRVQEAWSAIDIQLKRRADLVPNLVETVKGYAIHEQDTLAEVTRARSALQDAQGAMQAAEADNFLTQALGRLFAVVEAYPELKASENFISLQKDLYDLEEKIAYARQFYNRNVLDFNTRIRVFPQSIVAAMFGFAPMEFFESGERRGNVNVSFKK